MAKIKSMQTPFYYFRKFLHKVFKKNPFYGISLLGRSTSELLTIPADPWPGQFEVAQTLLEGSFPFGDVFDGRLIPLKNCLSYLAWSRSCPPDFLCRLHSFEWLRDLKSINTNPSRKFARQLVSHWIVYNHSLTKKNWLTPAWKNGIIGARLANWIALYDFFGASADDAFRRDFFKSLIRQYRYLRRNYSCKDDSLDTFLAIKGLIFCACTLPRQKHRISAFLKDLEKVLKKQLLPDGGHISRSPLIQFVILRDLIDIRLLLKGAELEIPLFVQNAIHVMAPLVRLFRHGDGALADFMGDSPPHSVGIETISGAAVDMALSLADVRGRSPGRALHMGFERCSSKAGLILLNTKPTLGGEPPLIKNGEPGIGILDFEWSVGRKRLIHRCDTIVQLADHSWLQVKDLKDKELSLKRYNKDGNGYIEAELEKSLGDMTYHLKRQLYLTPEAGDFRGHDSLTFSKSALVAVRFVFSSLVEMVSDSPQRIRLKVAHPFKEEGAHRKTSKHPEQIWRFISSGAESVICKQPKEPSPAYLFLLAPLVADKAQTIKWSFRLETPGSE